jgi:predicted DNA-binding transcriptional regulator YafY
MKEQLMQLHELIARRATGTPEQLAQTLGVSERTARSYLEQLKLMGATICYCRTRQTYYYCSPVVFKFGYEKEGAAPSGESQKRGG